MKWNKSALFLFLYLLFGGFLMAATIPQNIQNLIDAGEYAKARNLLMKAAEKEGVDPEIRKAYLWESERLRRIPFDFALTEEDVLKQIQTDMPNATRKDVEAWTTDGDLESLVIEGERRYYRRAVRNMYLLNKKIASRRVSRSTDRKTPKKDAFGVETSMAFHAKNALHAREKSESPFVTPQRFRIEYSLTVKPGEVPEGEVIRCWLPFPKECPTQKNIKLLKSFPENPLIAPREVDHRTVYLEQISGGDKPTTFSISFEYDAYAFVKPVDPAKVKPYDTNSEVYKKFAAERPPHITFTPEIRKKVEEICGNETNPYLKAKLIFKWVEGNIPWSGAIEYGLPRNLSERAFRRKTGDCGMQGLLLIAMCRIAGIPARWQSGWSLRPARNNMHDWTQFYIEPYGWLYADPSNGLIDSNDDHVKWYNFGNFDRYRLIVNSDYGMELHPAKKHFRSEPVDFQRGEVEWEGGNLYFNQWTWDFKATPIGSE
ncbi:transglutaminase domain-containing protein [Candidatus Sumerlaeota bacterium]|nr:transglutaminase domain-containing protein [Candidatus Sumerlaeota bacterium]